jgi:hypothetical protein
MMMMIIIMIMIIIIIVKTPVRINIKVTRETTKQQVDYSSFAKLKSKGKGFP